MHPFRLLVLTTIFLQLACTTSNLNHGDGIFAPGIAGESNIDGLIVGHRLMAAGEFELALSAYSRAAAKRGLNVDTLSALGSANLMLGRLWQAEQLLRRAVKEDASFAAAWNNLGVVLMERGQISEAAEVFRRAFATDNGNSDQIKQNLHLALAKRDNPSYDSTNKNETFQLVRRGTGNYLILSSI